MKDIVYLDNAASTRVAPEVMDAMLPYFGDFYGNASSIHAQGFDARQAVKDARQVIADSLNASPKEIIFTSGGTESNNFAIKGVAFALREKGDHIITTKTEHKCVMKSCEWLESQGFEITYLDVDEEGYVNPEDIEKAITDKTILVSILHANNEIGTIQDLEKIGALCEKHKVYFHSDACQSYTKIPLDVKKAKLTLLTINAHKINGPKGVGALYIKQFTKIDPLLHGGEQEFRLRAGTENTPGIVGFAKAVQMADKTDFTMMEQLRNQLIEGILLIPGTRLNGPRKRLCNNVNVSINAIEGEATEGMLDQHGICSSTGSACSEASLEPSYVLKAIGLTDEEANGSLRLTLSKETTDADVKKVIVVLPKVVARLREISPIKEVKVHVQ
ncbi:cysteine desulfurase [Candidatus Woesearchaeota archaeon]|nr:cysteine desulfurase [Candidatus Woesearchaeota archaeon]